MVKRNRRHATLSTKLLLLITLSLVRTCDSPAPDTMSAPCPERPVGTSMNKEFCPRRTPWITHDCRLSTLLRIVLRIFLCNLSTFYLFSTCYSWSCSGFFLLLLLSLLWSIGSLSFRLASTLFIVVVVTHVSVVPGFVGSYKGFKFLYLGPPKGWLGFNQTSSS